MGLQASGKTTLAQSRLCPLGYVRINLDELHTRHREQQLMQQCIGKGLSFVVDNTNATTADRQRYIEPAHEASYRVVGIFVRSVLRDCLRRNALRSRQVPTLALAHTSRILQLPSLSEGFDELWFCEIINQDFRLSKWIEQQ